MIVSNWEMRKWQMKHLAHVLRFPILFSSVWWLRKRGNVNGCQCFWTQLWKLGLANVFVEAGDQLLTSEIIPIAHRNRVSDTDSGICFLLLLSSKLPPTQDANALLSPSPCRSISLPLHPYFTPTPMDHFPRHYLSPSFLCRRAPNMVQMGIWVTLSSFSLHSPVCVKLVQSLSRVWAWRNK